MHLKKKNMVASKIIKKHKASGWIKHAGKIEGSVPGTGSKENPTWKKDREEPHSSQWRSS